MIKKKSSNDNIVFGPGKTALYFNNVGLFSDPFLEERLPNLEKYYNTPSTKNLNKYWNIDEFDPVKFNKAYQDILSLWESLDKDITSFCSNERQLQNTWIDKIFESLGWKIELEESVTKQGVTNFPDYGLYRNVDDWKEAKLLTGNNKLKKALAVADAKYWGVNLDGKGFSNKNPSYQIINYLKQTDKKWGILTDGRYWRIYSTRSESKHSTYFEIDLPVVLRSNDIEQFKYFYNFFRMEAFEMQASLSDRCFLDFVFEDGQSYSVRVEKNLKERAYRVVESIAKGFYADSSETENLDEVYEHSLYYLFKLMFVLNCESKALLEVNKQDDYYELSLRKKCIELKKQYEEGKKWSNQKSTYSYINDLFDLLKNGDELIGVHGFGSEPFAVGKEEFYNSTKISDKYLNIALIDLSCDYDEDDNLQFIDYKILSPDHIGSLFEGLLEYKLKNKNETVELSEEGDGERRDSGSYFTPDFAVDYIIEKTVGPIVEGLNTQSILEKKFCDTAMGSGHFLLGLLKYLEKSILDYQDKNPKDKLNLDNAEIKWSVLHNCLHGVDLNNLAVELAKFSMWIYTAEKGEALEPLSSQFLNGDSLCEERFSWNENFSDILVDNEGFDAIVGNPPYVTESRNNAELFRGIKENSDLSEYYEKNCDLFNFFIIRSINLLKNGGRLGYIVPQYLISRTGCNNPRIFMSENGGIDHYVDFGKFNVFEEASGHHSILFSYEKGLNKEKTLGNLLGNNELKKIVKSLDKEKKSKNYRKLLEKAIDMHIRDNCSEISIVQYLQADTKRSSGQSKYIITDPHVGEVLSKIVSSFDHNLFEDENISNGVQTYPDRVKENKKDKVDKGVFVLNKNEVKDLKLNLAEKKLLKKFYYPKEVDRYSYNFSKNKYCLIYTDKVEKENVTNNIKNYKQIVSHLKSMKKYITSANKPYGIHRARDVKYFEGTARIVGPRKCLEPSFFLYDKNECYMDESVNSIVVEDAEKFFSLAFVNSMISHFFLYNFKKQGQQLQIDKESLVELRVPSKTFTKKGIEIKNKISELAKEICEKGDLEKEEEINNLFFKLFDLSKKDVALITSELDGIKGSEKSAA